MSKETSDRPFSADLKVWLKHPGPKTVFQLNEVFGEKSLAIIILVLMFLPALPLPTGGVSHVFEVIAMLVALQLMIGRRTIWLPKSWLNREIKALRHQKTASGLVKSVRWLERFTRRRFAGFLQSKIGLFIAGLSLFVFALAAFLSPPFSGLDTFPSVGAVIVALSLIAEDMLVFWVGVLAGIGGIALIIGLGTALATFISHLFS